MSNYTKVQFISWELYTGPVNISSTSPSRGWYSGLMAVPTSGTSIVPTPDARVDVIGQCIDIDARVAFTADAIAKAHAKADSSSSTLKVFLAPEFLYRGAGGAYIHDLINGWVSSPPTELSIPSGTPYSGKWGGLFGKLQALVANADYEDWLFVFGSAIGASFPAKQASDTKYYLDPSKAAEIYNISLVQRGGPDHTGDNYASRKQYVSPIDFLDQYARYVSHIGSQVQPFDDRTVVPADVLGVVEGGALFNIASICDSTGKAIVFGLEVCLDHARSGGINPATHLPVNNFGRIRTANQYVKIQLVPSGGMNLEPDSIRLAPAAGPTPHSYAFNCDGLTDMTNHYGSHTQIWNGANGAPVLAANKLLEGGNGQDLSTAATPPLTASTVSAVAHNVTIGAYTIADSLLWSNGSVVSGSGSVRVVAPLAL
jgi:hypothetical protein